VQGPFQALLARRAAPALRSIAIGITIGVGIGVGIGFSKNFDFDPDSDFGEWPCSSMAVTEPCQNMSRRKELLAIVYRYTLNFLCTTKSEDPFLKAACVQRLKKPAELSFQLLKRLSCFILNQGPAYANR
jgi:hypothetical protein